MNSGDFFGESRLSRQALAATQPQQVQPAAPEISRCPKCGGVLEEAPGGGLGCMSCLLRAGVRSEEEVAQDSNQNSLEGGARFGVYEIDCHADGSICELGRGAMGVTYRATDTSLQRKVALKLIKTEVAERSAVSLEERVHRARLLHFRATIDKSTDTRSREVFELTNLCLQFEEDRCKRALL